jgi:hypothetical protein
MQPSTINAQAVVSRSLPPTGFFWLDLSSARENDSL